MKRSDKARVMEQTKRLKRHNQNIKSVLGMIVEVEKLRKEKDQSPSFLDFLVQLDVIEKMRPLLESGWIIDENTGKITACTAIDWTRKWVYVNPDQNRICDVYQAIHNCCEFVPGACMDCWKVVVKMRTVEQLMAMLTLQTVFTDGFTGKDRFCKCGVEEREYVHYNYGAYFYCDSRQQAQERYNQVFDLMKKNTILAPLLEEVDDRGRTTRLIFKRYCTEFELKQGPTDRYERPAWADAIEAKVLGAIDRYKGNPVQPKYLIEHCIAQWLKFAWDRGDNTVTRFNNGGPLYSQVVTYHSPPAGARPPAGNAKEAQL